MAILPMRLYFLSAIKKDWYRSRAWWHNLNMPLSDMHFMVQHLVEVTASTSMITQTVTQTHTHTLAVRIQFQVESKTNEQSWLGLTSSHLMRWRFSISVETMLHGNYYFNSVIIHFLRWLLSFWICRTLSYTLKKKMYPHVFSPCLASVIEIIISYDKNMS